MTNYVFSQQLPSLLMLGLVLILTGCGGGSDSDLGSAESGQVGSTESPATDVSSDSDSNTDNGAPADETLELAVTDSTDDEVSGSDDELPPEAEPIEPPSTDDGSSDTGDDQSSDPVEPPPTAPAPTDDGNTTGGDDSQLENNPLEPLPEEDGREGGENTGAEDQPATEEGDSTETNTETETENGSDTESDSETETEEPSEEQDLPNRAPTAIEPRSSSFPENTSNPSITLTTIDPDAGDTHIYEISGGLEAELFSISGNVLILEITPDFENPNDSVGNGNNFYGVNVVVTDQDGLSYVEDVVFEITDVADDETPTEDNLETADESEPETATQVVGNFTEAARQELQLRIQSGYTLGPGFDDDIQTMFENLSSFTADPSATRPTFGANSSVPNVGQNLHISALYAYALEDVVTANIVAEELLDIINGVDLFDDFYSNSANIRWDNDNGAGNGGARWIESAKVKKMYESYEFIEHLQTIYTEFDIAAIEAWFQRFKELAETATLGRYQSAVGFDIDTATVQFGDFFNQFYLPFGGDTTATPLYDSNGEVLTDYVMTLGQDLFNNRQWDAITYIHAWSVRNDDLESEFWTRQVFKAALKYNLFPDGTYAELWRNLDRDPTLGVFYSFITLAGMIEMAHNDALFNHFPDDRLFDYTTTEGFVQGSTENSRSPYVGSSTTDGETEKSLYTLIVGQSKYLLGEADGGWNDTRYYRNSQTGELTPMDVTGKRQPSAMIAIANAYYEDPYLKSFYQYLPPFPPKVQIFEGYTAPFYNSDVGPWGNLIIGVAWYEQEGNFHANLQ